MTREWALGDVHEIVSSAIPEREMIVFRDQRRTYGEIAERSRALAQYLHSRHFGAHRERTELARWECGQDRVALLMHNTPEHVEAILACWKARVVPCNVNYHYTAGEVADLLRRVGVRGVIYDRGLGAKLVDVATSLDLLVEVDDGRGGLERSGGRELRGRARARQSQGEAPAGVTGRSPRRVHRRHDRPPQSGALAASRPFRRRHGRQRRPRRSHGLRTRAVAGAGIWFPTSPLMHVASQWTTFMACNMGATVVLHDDTRPFDVRTILEVASRERVNMMTIVGDAYARPMIDELRRTGYDLSSLATIGSGGAATSREAKSALMDLLPHVQIRDGYGASEVGAMASGESPRDGEQIQLFSLGLAARLLSDDRTRFLDVGEDQVGWMARYGGCPLGYLDDEEATQSTFPVIDGVRIAIPGDRARFAPDGRVELLGRDSLVVNTGGEKVFVEEVEEVLKRHADVARRARRGPAERALRPGIDRDRRAGPVTVDVRPQAAP